jgi:DNA ligase 1
MSATWMSTRRAFLGACLALPIAGWTDESDDPALMLANVYREDLAPNLAHFWVSEKLDGVRALWTGAKFLTRAGNPITAPTWFTARLPRVALDGELWGGRNLFERTSGIVRSSLPSDAAWRTLKYMVFDMPRERGSFDGRLSTLLRVTTELRSEYLHAIEQVRVKDATRLEAKLREIEAEGGEGLMLHRGDSQYVVGRSNDLLKLKSFTDAEAEVVGYEPGNGKYVGMMGALLVERADGRQFKIGSGFSDDERAHPPAIGSWITYAYNGETNTGLPRFPRYLRRRHDMEQPPW